MNSPGVSIAGTVSVPLAKPPLAKYLGGTIPPVDIPNPPNILPRAFFIVETGFVTIFFIAEATFDTPVATDFAAATAAVETAFTAIVAGFVIVVITLVTGLFTPRFHPTDGTDTVGVTGLPPNGLNVELGVVVGFGVGAGVPVEYGITVGAGVPEGFGVPVALGVVDGVGVPDGTAEGFGEDVGVGSGVLVGVGEDVGVGSGSDVAPTTAATEGSLPLGFWSLYA